MLGQLIVEKSGKSTPVNSTFSSVSFQVILFWFHSSPINCHYLFCLISDWWAITKSRNGEYQQERAGITGNMRERAGTSGNQREQARTSGFHAARVFLFSENP